MNRRDVLKVMGGVVAIPVVGLTAGATESKSLPVAQYHREVSEDRIVRILTNGDEIMGKKYEHVGDNSLHDADGPVFRRANYLSRSRRVWVNKEDAEYLLHPKTLTPIRVWGEVDMTEGVVLSNSGAFKDQQGVFHKVRTVGMTDKTQWEERKWVFDHTVTKDKHQFTVYREDCNPERIGDVQELHYKIDRHDGKSITYSLCGPVKDGKWRTEWNAKEQALMANIVANEGE
jgi:hypothetical protein